MVMYQARQLLEETAELLVIWHQVKMSGVAGWMKVSAVLSGHSCRDHSLRTI